MGLHRAGSLATGDWELELTPERAGWAYAGLRVLALEPGGSRTVHTGPDEVVVLPLSGSCTVECGGERAELAGRASVFSGPSDVAYAPPGATLTVSSVDGGRFALPSARAERGRAFRHVTGVPVELRGAGASSRQVHGFAMEDLDAERILACEVITPAGNWSSYPPHKHDEDRPGESVLEEIYWYEGGPGYQRTDELLAEVRAGDLITIPRGWHGPSMAPPGYDLYYLNVMAGPGERTWRITDQPEYAWVHETWADQPWRAG